MSSVYTCLGRLGGKLTPLLSTVLPWGGIQRKALSFKFQFIPLCFGFCNIHYLILSNCHLGRCEGTKTTKEFPDHGLRLPGFPIVSKLA